jgi:tetratricopeptide (TPR) repeat protein
MKLRQGRVILFLGAGASIGAEHPTGKTIPTSEKLSTLLANEFLGPEFAERSLSQVAELSISEADLFTVQSFISSVFEPFQPADFHRLIPKFRWKAIATTNFDLIVETSYDQVDDRIQSPVVFIKNGQRVEEQLQGQDSLIYLKLHGCITDIYDENIPLILTPDQYVTYRENRDRLFDRLKEYFYEYTFIFVGYRIADYNIRAILQELTGSVPLARPRSYLVLPQLSGPEVRFYESKRITHLEGTFEEFLKKADSEVPAPFRKLMTLQKPDEHPIFRKLRLGSHHEPSPSLITLITRDTDYVHPDIKPTELDPRLFYKGYFPDWTPIYLDLDVSRSITGKLLTEVILESGDRDPELPEFFVLKGHAGSGKSIVLRRLAWDASKELDVLCLWLKKGQLPRYEALLELYRLSDQRIFFFVDPVTDYISLVQNLLIKALKDKLPITIIAAERYHEWNVECEELEPYLSEEYNLYNLSEKEIDNLIDLLGKHDSLGHLKGLTIEEQREQLEQHAGRQLLVALHEATMGKPFADIVHDEYLSISPQKAKSLYLTVCIFHRLGVPARAGLISRVHNIPFRIFESDLFEPLESIVFDHYDQRIQDRVYLTRHSHIAELVFQRVLTTPQDRYDEYSRIISEIDYDYYSDREAFHGIINAKELLSLFPDPQDIRNLYSAAHDRVRNAPWLFQQEAIFEMNSDGGSLDRANKLLSHANELDPENRLILHSLSELMLKHAEESTNAQEKAKFRNRAREKALRIIATGHISPYPYHTLIKVDIDELSELLDEGDEPSIERSIKKIDKRFSDAKQRFPDDSFIASSEADFLKLIHQNEKAISALRRAFDSAKGSPYITTRLARVYEAQGDIEKAIEVLETSIEINPGAKRINFQLAKTLMKLPNPPNSRIKHYLKRSFTEGDSNFIAQFEFARILYIQGEFNLANKYFDSLKSARVPIRMKDRPRGTFYNSDGEPVQFKGNFTLVESSYGFLKRDRFADDVFTHKSFNPDLEWDIVTVGQRVLFNLAFTYRGAVAINITFEN